MVISQQRVGRLAGVWSSLLYQLIEDFLYGVKCGLVSFYPLRLGVYETQNRFLPLHVFLQTATNQLFLPKFQIRCLVLPLRFFFFSGLPPEAWWSHRDPELCTWKASVALFLPRDRWLHWSMKVEGEEARTGFTTAVGTTKALWGRDFSESGQFILGYKECLGLGIPRTNPNLL